MLSVCIWTGGVNNYWNNANNWKDASDQPVLPAVGDTLQFAASQHTETINDFPAGMSFESIEFSENGFSLAGNRLTLTQGITVDPGVTDSEVLLNIAMNSALTFDVPNGVSLAVDGAFPAATIWPRPARAR